MKQEILGSHMTSLYNETIRKSVAFHNRERTREIVEIYLFADDNDNDDDDDDNDRR